MQSRYIFLKINLLAVFFAFSAFTANADIRLPAIFGSHMVVQQQDTFRLWGWAAPEDDIAVYCSWLPDREFSARADRGALRWAVEIPTPAAGFTPHTITIKGGWSDLVLDDILFGEVWLCSGQSNMEWQPAWGNVDVTEAQYAAANDPGLRFFSVPRLSVPEPERDCRGEWQVSTRETMHRFSATAYFFGRELRDRLGIPVGLINASWGGTPIESWMHEADFQSGELARVINDRHPVWRYGRAGSLWNGMIAPIKSLNIKGFLWYQGETNTYNPGEYARLLSRLADDWRADFRKADLPFYYVQIAPWRYGVPREGAAVRDEQRRALRRLRNAGMVVVSDIGDVADIHPRNKADVGKRLAAWALTHTYGVPGLPYSGPLFRDFAVQNDQIRVSFDFAENGLRAKDGPLRCFEIAGEDRKFYPAQAEITGDAVVVSAREVPRPVAVRFAFDNVAEPNLYNADGLPASCFRTDDWPAVWPLAQFSVKKILDNGDALVDISCPDPACRIRYTLDGAEPSETTGEWASAGTPLQLGRGKTLTARVFDAGGAPADRTERFTLRQHLASGAPASGDALPGSKYPGSAGAFSLTDGLSGSADPHHNAWQGYEGDSLVRWTFDLGSRKKVRQVSASFLVATGNWIFPPAQVAVAVSKDGQKFTELDPVRIPLPTRHVSNFVQSFTLPVDREARFVRVTAKGLDRCPEWHQGAGKKAWLFVDEVVVE